MLDTEFDPAHYVRVESLSLQQLFHDRGHFWLPWAQRSYAWRDDNVRRLLSDLFTGYQSPEHRYFLGYVSTAMNGAISGSAIADGQQRLITLSLLFAELRARLPDGDVRDCLTACLVREPTVGAAPLLELQESLNDVYVTQLLSKLDPPEERALPMDLSPPEQRLLLNRHTIADALDGSDFADGAALEQFARFCLTRCIVVLQSVDSEAEALQILATEEETGLPFHSTERTKVTLISLMPRRQQAKAGEIWDRMQSQLGQEGLAELLNHIRVLKAGGAWKGSSKTPVETDLAHQFNCRADGLAFLQDEALPTLEAYTRLRVFSTATRRLDPAATRETPLEAALVKLNWLDHTHWHLPAIAWLRRFGLNAPEAVTFFEDLDRLAWTYRIANGDQKNVSAAFAAIAGRIAKAGSPVECPRLEPPKDVARAARASLTSRTFYYKTYAAIVLRRLSALLGADPGPRDNVNLSGEHILPRNPAENSQWRIDFGDKGDAKKYSDRLGNLCFLTPEDNDLVGNKDWRLKQPVLQASDLSLAQDAASYATWTRETIRQRTDKLVQLLRNDLRF